MSDTRTRGHAPDTRRIRVRYATWRIVDQTVGQRIWILLGHGGDTAGHRRDMTWTRRADFMVFFLLWALKNPNSIVPLPQLVKYTKTTRRKLDCRLRLGSESE